MIAKYSIIIGNRFTGDFPWAQFNRFFKVDNWPTKVFANPVKLNAAVILKTVKGLQNVKIYRISAFPDDESLRSYLQKKKQRTTLTEKQLEKEENIDIILRLNGIAEIVNFSYEKSFRTAFIQNFLLAKYSILHGKRFTEYWDQLFSNFVAKRGKVYTSISNALDSVHDGKQFRVLLKNIRPKDQIDFSDIAH